MKNIFLQLLFWFGLFFILVGVGTVLKAEDTFKDPNPNIVLTEWTTQLIYDTTNACYQGTVKWIILSHPSLYGIPPGLESAREMITHCFCVMDRIRNEFEVEEYRKKVFDGEFIGTLFMNKAFEWYKKASELGYANSSKNIGDLYDKGDTDFPKDEEKALEWCRNVFLE